MHFRPADGHVGDVIPFYWNGEYHAFYLKRQLNDPINLPWAHAVSTDLVHWNELPVALEIGGPEDPDAESCATGSVIEHKGIFHIFYTGFNPGRRNYPPQTICHATGLDLIHWKKDLSNPILVPDRTWYENDDWRDPFIFWNEEEKCYWMLICARVKDAPTPKRGCIAVAKSRDLAKWVVYPPLWSPYLIYAPECPDLFRANGWWYLIFSNVETRYRMAESLRGPWLRSPVEALDDSRFYAAKTLSNGQRRFLLGWIPSQEGERDEGRWEWGGHMAVPREIVVQPDGSLGVRCPREILEAFKRIIIKPGLLIQYEVGTGFWSTNNEGLVGSMKDGSAFVKLPQAPDDYFLETTITLDSSIASAGFMFRMSDTLETGYTLTVEPFAHRAAFRYWRTWGDTELIWNIPMWSSPQPPVERPLDVQPGKPLNCKIIVMGTILEAFFNDQIAMSARMYNHRKGRLCLFVQNGQARFENLYLAETS